MTEAPVDANGAPYAAYLVVGDDASLVSQELSKLVTALAELDGVGPGAVEEYGDGAQDEAFSVGPVLSACRTPPFLADRRIVVVRDSADLDAAAQREIAGYLEDPLETTILVVALVSKPVVALQRALDKTGVVVRAEPATGRARQQWINEHLQRSTLRLDPAATTALSAHLGEDLARLEGIIGTLESAYGPGAVVHEGELTPFLGEAGGVAPWDLTDALDSGDLPRSLTTLHRMLEGGERHPLQVVAVLQRHFGAMLRLDGADLADEADAAAATGLAPFPAKKALAQARRLGHERISQAISLLAAADLDLRGGIGWPGELVLEILVARLANLVRQRATPQRSRPAR